MRQALNVETLKVLYGRIARRYDVQHAFLTAGADQRGRRILVDHSVREGDDVLDCGSGTGKAGLMAAKRSGPKGRVTLFDVSDSMLSIAREKALEEGVADRVRFQTGNMARLPFESDRFDVVLSTYSLCPLYDPRQAALELYRVAKPGGKIAVAHSTQPRHPLLKKVSERVENLAWHFPSLSMGCRPVRVRPALEEAGGEVVFSRYIGVPLWPFFVFVFEKPAPRAP